MQFFNNKGNAIHYKLILSDEKDVTFLFINSLGTDLRIWDDVADIIRAHGNILLFDKRGHGLSDEVANTSCLDDFADDVIALLDYHSIKKCIVVGLSVGGMIAQVLADRVPGRISKLVLCDTMYRLGSAESWNERIAQVKGQGSVPASEIVMRRWFSLKFRNEHPIKVRGYQNMTARTSLPGYINTCVAIRDADLNEIAGKINIPTLCIVGSEDQSTTPVEVKELAKAIKTSSYVVIDGSGHLPCVEFPVLFSNLIIDFSNT